VLQSDDQAIRTVKVFKPKARAVANSAHSEGPRSGFRR
jgi:hypothetical protein